LKNNTLHKNVLLTPSLWKESSIYNIQQFEINDFPNHFDVISEKLRLGMFVEQTIFQSIEQNPNTELIAKNLQIIENGITIGEIDCLFKENEFYTHLEIVYKFYLFDPRINKDEINCWIGPNRKDSLIEKLDKLRDKQFPLLYHPQTKEILNELNLNANQFTQKVCFKAQLYVPFNHFQENYNLINPSCIVGYYYRLNELTALKDCKFHIPNKINWLENPNTNINWLSFEAFCLQIELLLNEKRSPLCFVKDKKGNLFKIFVVWWD